MLLPLASADETLYRTPFYVHRYCEMRAERLATLIHATSRIPLSERQLIALEDRMIERASQATSNDDVTVRVNAVQDEFADSIPYRSPRMWKFCHQAATMLAMRLSLESTKPNRASAFDLRWRHRTAAALCRRMFRAAARATDDADVNARLRTLYNEALTKHGIAPVD
jgi:hypothetical protein